MNVTDASKDYDKEATAPRRLPTRKAQANLNDRNARRHLVQLVITNFDERDLHVTLTYGPGQEPTTEAEARRDRDNFVRRLAAANKKAGGAPLKYIIVTEHKDADPAAGIKGIRYHHHVILSCGLDRDKIESLWARKGERLGWCNADRLQFERGSIEALARYLLKDAKGLYILDYWTTTMQATVKELTADTIAAAMTAAKKTTEENVAGYDVIVPKSAIELDDYTENVTYIGRLVGSEKPIIIQIFNAFNTNDLSIQPKDNDEASVQVIFTGHYDPNDLETPPYKIYWPKEA